MPFLNYDECDARFVVSFQLDASFSDCCELMLKNLYQQDMKYAEQLPVETQITGGQGTIPHSYSKCALHKFIPFKQSTPA
jgi:hypothetical protein